MLLPTTVILVLNGVPMPDRYTILKDLALPWAGGLEDLLLDPPLHSRLHDLGMYRAGSPWAVLDATDLEHPRQVIYAPARFYPERAVHLEPPTNGPRQP